MMSDPRHMHEFLPNRRGKCKHLVGSSICGQGEMVPEHHRWAIAQAEAAKERVGIICPGCRAAGALLDKITWEFVCDRCGSTCTYDAHQQVGLGLGII